MRSFQLIYTPEAKEDVTSAATYYNSQLHGLGKVFKNEVKRQLTLIKQNPHTHSIRYDNIRFAVTRKFPYSIHYSIYDNVVTIHAVISHHRNPMEHWKI